MAELDGRFAVGFVNIKCGTDLLPDDGRRRVAEDWKSKGIACGEVHGWIECGHHVMRHSAIKKYHSLVGAQPKHRLAFNPKYARQVEGPSAKISAGRCYCNTWTKIQFFAADRPAGASVYPFVKYLDVETVSPPIHTAIVGLFPSDSFCALDVRDPHRRVRALARTCRQLGGVGGSVLPWPAQIPGVIVRLKAILDLGSFCQLRRSGVS